MSELPRKNVFEAADKTQIAKVIEAPAAMPVAEGGRSASDDAAVRIRDQALEEAARIADQVAAGRDDMLHGLAALGALIADGIRSLKQCEQSTRSA
jgi:hypothetical protein